jgi:sigma-E factor negative regulatory protein RseC
MNETNGMVERVEGDFAWVRAAGPGHACGACAQKDGCHASSAGAVDEALGQAKASNLLCLPNPIQARPGDAVVIRAEDGTILRTVWLAYGLPLLLALGGAASALELTGSEGFAVAGMLLGLVAGFGFLWRISKNATQGEPILSIDFKSIL